MPKFKWKVIQCRRDLWCNEYLYEVKRRCLLGWEFCGTFVYAASPADAVAKVRDLLATTTYFSE